MNPLKRYLLFAAAVPPPVFWLCRQNKNTEERDIEHFVSVLRADYPQNLIDRLIILTWPLHKLHPLFVE